MTVSSHRAMLVALALAASLTGACTKKDATPSADSSSVRPPVALQVQSVDLGRAIGADKRVTVATDDFTRRDTIYVSVASTGSGSGTMTAHWTFEDGQVVEHSEQSVSPTGPAVTEFHMAKATPWPAGKYKVVITLDGREVGNKEFEVK